MGYPGLAGVDIPEGMLAQARARGVYDYRIPRRATRLPRRKLYCSCPRVNGSAPGVLDRDAKCRLMTSRQGWLRNR